MRQKEGKILQIIPFNSRRKRASTVLQMADGSVRVFLKGAPEIVIDYCTKWIDQHGDPQELTEEKRKHILGNIVTQTFAKKAFRTIMIAYGDISKQDYEDLRAANNNFKSENDREVLEKALTVIGIYALQDPLRDEIVDSVVKCKSAGINIRMVTGDNLDTAKAIAIEAGIVS